MRTLKEVTLRHVPVVGPRTTLDEVIEQMNADPLKTVVIVGDGQYFGIFTPTDLESGRIPADAKLEDLAVGPYANGLRFVGSPQMTAADAMELMHRHDIPVLPVVAGCIFKGVVIAEDLQ